MFSFKHPDAYAQVVSMSEENSDPSDPSGVACNMIEVFFICKTSDPMSKRRIGKILLKRKLYVMPRGYLEDQKDDITDGGEGNMFGDFIKTCLTTRHVHMIKLPRKTR